MKQKKYYIYISLKLLIPKTFLKILHLGPIRTRLSVSATSPSGYT